MSWILSSVECLRAQFVMIACDPNVSMSEACRQFSISRKTGCKWRRRYSREGMAGLITRRRRPNKIPSLVTIGRILKRAGLAVAKRRGRPRSCPASGPLTPAPGPNEVWTVDFKGWWRTKDGKRCEPLSVRDLFSRYILCLQPVKRVRIKVLKHLFELLFERYGLPQVIRTDNGAPFASVLAPHGLTQLSAWWRTLGIRHDRIEPGHPEQNGSHERMHRDVETEIARTPADTLLEETERLEIWRQVYNVQRPHEALGMKTPAEVYRCSSRQLHQVTPYACPESYECYRVRKNGSIRFKDGRELHISRALVGMEVGLERVGVTGWRVWFCDLMVKTNIPESAADSQPEPAPESQHTPVLLPRPFHDCNPSPDNKVLPVSCS